MNTFGGERLKQKDVYKKLRQEEVYEVRSDHHWKMPNHLFKLYTAPFHAMRFITEVASVTFQRTAALRESSERIFQVIPK